MQKVQYIFCDPGTANFGMVLMKFVLGKVEVYNRTLNFNKSVFSELHQLKEHILSVEKPLKVFLETNHFRNNPALTHDLATVTASLQAFLLIHFSLAPGELEVYERSSLCISRELGIPKNTERNDKKHIVTEAFKRVFKTKIAPTNHEADAFAAGAVIITSNKDLKVEKNLRTISETFLENVDEILKLHCPETYIPDSGVKHRVRSRRTKKRKTKVLANNRKLPKHNVPGTKRPGNDPNTFRVYFSGDSDFEHSGDGTLRQHGTVDLPGPDLAECEDDSVQPEGLFGTTSDDSGGV